jgi:hypothetical protein
MLKMRIIAAFAILTICLAFNAASAQRNTTSPLSPAEKPIEKGFGLFIGIGNNAENGSIHTSACNCDFSGGNGFGFTAGLLFEQAFNSLLMWGIAGMIDLRNISAAFKEWETINAQSIITDFSEPVTVLMRHTADINLTYLTAYPYLKFTPADFIYLRFGPGASLLANANIKHTKYLETSSATLTTGEEVTLSIGKNGTSQVIENDKISSTNSMQFDVISMVGFNIPFGTNLNLSPGFMFTLPLTNIRSNGDSFKVSSWRFFLEFRIIAGKYVEAK